MYQVENKASSLIQADDGETDIFCRGKVFFFVLYLLLSVGHFSYFSMIPGMRDKTYVFHRTWERVVREPDG